MTNKKSFIEHYNNVGVFMSPDTLYQIKLKQYLKYLNEVAIDKVNGKYDKVKYEIQVDMIGRSCGIPTCKSRENLNKTVKYIRMYQNTGDEKYLQVPVYIREY